MNKIKLNPIEIDQAYRDKWNIRMNDYMLLSKDGQPIRDTLYRIGRMGNSDLSEGDYFLLIKQYESHYPKDIDPKQPPRLDGRWCIIDKEGNEKFVVPEDSIDSLYLIKDSCIYSLGGKYYNIETGQYYCNPSTVMESMDFLFLENKYDDNTAKKGIMKINKKDGTWVLIP